MVGPKKLGVVGGVLLFTSFVSSTSLLTRSGNVLTPACSAVEVRCPAGKKLKISEARYSYSLEGSAKNQHDEVITTHFQNQCNCRESCTERPPPCAKNHVKSLVQVNFECKSFADKEQYECFTGIVSAVQSQKCTTTHHVTRHKRILPQKRGYFELPLRAEAWMSFYRHWGGGRDGRIFTRNGLHGHPGSPVQQMGLMTINFEGGNTEIPLFIRATLLHDHVHRRRRGSLSTAVITNQMRAMGQYQDDHVGHLLAHSLGGDEIPENLVPMASSLNVGRRINEQFAGDVPLEGIRSSLWRANEHRMANFLGAHINHTIDFTVVVLYGSNALFNPEWGRGPNQFFRPTHFIVEFTCYNPDGSVHEHSHIAYINSNSYACHYLTEN